MLPIKDFEKRFRELLDELDELRDTCADCDEDMDELCADFEDALFVLECTEPDDEDAEDAFRDALDEISDVADALIDISDDIPEMKKLTQRLSSLLTFAGNAIS